MTQERKALRRLVRGALIAAIYAVLCAALAPISYGEVPVSYTHLDVYKRQTWRRAGAAATRTWPWACR